VADDQRRQVGARDPVRTGDVERSDVIELEQLEHGGRQIVDLDRAAQLVDVERRRGVARGLLVR
jgi:hypothetical protein